MPSSYTPAHMTHDGDLDEQREGGGLEMRAAEQSEQQKNHQGVKV